MFNVSMIANRKNSHKNRVSQNMDGIFICIKFKKNTFYLCFVENTCSLAQASQRLAGTRIP